ncbi:RNA 3'-terminal phosphate cyclase-like [Oppia nitens]|uniref:RNA 3'-terminal phosphate cyclase-like n=1 Tax=Oppia nitens TaxID=1686743 RepID=UPI0023DC7872|nr:RNA 3'-terminal phosphate cyclase-like [Oppia nitens]
MLEIDGSLLEGGGQVVRMAMSLSSLMSKAVHICNVRSGRTKPGLKAQHLIGLQLIRDITCGQLKGDQMASTEVTFQPNTLTSGTYFGDTKTAGSVTLLFQISFPCLLYCSDKSYLRLKGGTNAEMAPQIDYTLNVLRPVLSKFGLSFDCDLIRRGFFPKGGGEVVFGVDSIHQILSAQLTEFGQLTRISGHSFVSGVLPINMAHSMAKSASNLLREAFPGVSIDIRSVHHNRDEAFGNGSGIVLVAESSTGLRMGGSALGRQSVSAEAVGQSAAKELIEDMNYGATVDRYLQDQLIIFMALANGKSSIICGPLTTHTQTAIHFAQQITGAKFEVKSVVENIRYLIECNGIGFVNKFIGQ